MPSSWGEWQAERMTGTPNGRHGTIAHHHCRHNQDVTHGLARFLCTHFFFFVPVRALLCTGRGK